MDEKTEVQKAMAKDCIILFTVNETLTAAMIILRRQYPGWFKERSGMEALEISIDTKCLGPACAQYNVFANRCGFSK